MNTPANPGWLDADEPVGQLIDALIDVGGDRNAFQRLLADRPQVLDQAVERGLRHMAQAPGFGATFEAFADLVRDARTDPEGACATFDGRMARAQRLGEEVEQVEGLITAAVDEGRPVDALKLVQKSIEKANRAGLAATVADLHLRAGQILIGGGVADRDQEVETAIAEFEAGLTCAGSHEQEALLLMHLGLAGPERVRGDRRENVEQAMEALQAALDTLGDRQADDLDAYIRTNLASVMLGRETDDRVQNLTGARRLVEKALEFRTPDRDAEDWAYSQVNLGLILDRLAQEGAGEPEEALAAWQAVIDEADRCPSWLVGHAHHGIGQHLAAQAEPAIPEFDDDEDDEVDFADEDFEPDPELLRRARDHLRAARILLVDAPNQLERGRALNDLAGVLTDLEEIDEAMAVGAEALNLLGPTTSPRDCVIIAGRLGTQLADRGRWQEAADVFRAGVHAAEVAIDTRLDADDRRREAQRTGNIARWASYCLARIDEPVAAALTLENGRTRELRRRLGSAAAGEGALDALPQELRQAYEGALATLTSAHLDGSGSNASRALQEVLHEIREQPGLESFAAGTDEEGLVAAVQSHWPLMYVNPTPWGTLLLLIGHTDSGPQIASKFLEPASLEVFLRLMAGDAAETMDFDEDSEARSYLLGISTDDVDHDVRDDLEQALPWLGRHICSPIAEILREQGAKGVTLVISGPLVAAPLHAATWDSGGDERCLLDALDVRSPPRQSWKPSRSRVLTPRSEQSRAY